MIETETEENKESWNEDCIKALAALANTRGGTLRIGVRHGGSIRNSEHQAMTGAASRTATRDLEQLTEMGLLERSVHTGRTVQYVMPQRFLLNKPNAPSNTP